MSALEGNTEVPAATPDEDLGPRADWKRIPRDPSQLAWRLDIPEATRAGPWCPRRNSRGIPSFPLQLKKIQEILSSMRDEALFHCGVSRKIPLSLLSLERVLDTIVASKQVPRHTCLHSRGTPMVLPQLKKSPVFPSSSRDEVHFPNSFGKICQCSRRTSRGTCLNLKLERNSGVVLLGSSPSWFQGIQSVDS